MKTNTKVGKEICVTTADRIGVLSQVTMIVSGAGVNISAMCAYATDDAAHFRFITDNNKKARDVLSKAGFDSIEKDVVISEVSPHSIPPEAAVFAGTANTSDDYWCASATGGEHAVIIMPLKVSSGMASIR